MLFKLIKHEFIASYRTYLPVYVAMYALALLSFVSFQISDNVFSYVLVAILALLEGALGIFSVYNLVISLGVRVYGKQGYLLMSIPAKTQEIMGAKYLVNFIWILVSGFVMVSSLFLTISMMGLGVNFHELLSELFYYLSLSFWDGLTIVIFLIVYISYYIMFFMFLFAMLNLVYKGEKKILYGVLLYFGLSMVISSIINAFSLPVLEGLIMGGINWTIGTLWYEILVYFTVTSAMTFFTYRFMKRKMELN